jgi:glutamyl-tRNA reductase
MFETALHVGRRVRSETSLSNGKYSVGAEAASLAARRFGSLRHARVLVVGSGKTGARVARQLDKLGARDLVLLNRTEERATALATQLHARVAPLDLLHQEAAMADIVILATDAPAPLLRADPLVCARRSFSTSGHALLVIDLAMPRNVESSIRSIAGVVLVDLDALRPAVSEGERERVAAIPAAEAIVGVELQRFADWIAAAEVREAIRPFCDMLGAVCRQEVAFVSGDLEVAERTANRIVAKLLAYPMVELRAALAREERVDVITDALHRLFASHAAAPHASRTRAIA